MKKIFCYLTLSAAVMGILPSCVGLDTAPYDKETDLTFWSGDPNSALYALNSCYGYITSMDEMITMEGATDNAYVKGLTSTQPIANGSYSTSNSYVKGIWDNKYSGIRVCNELLNNIDKTPSLSADLKARYIAEATVIRAFLYYELYTKFGDVPYVTTTISVQESETISRTPRATVLANVISDLESAINSNALPASYSTDDRGRITIGAAKAILAKVYLFECNYEKVLEITDDIIASGTYSLFSNYSGLFEVANEYNCEVILDAQYATALREFSMRSIGYVPPSLGGYAEIGPTQELVDSYIMTNGKAITDADSGYDAENPYVNRDPRLKASIIYTGNSYILADGTEYVVNCEEGADGYNTTSDVTPTGYYLRKWWDKSYRLTLQSGLNPIIIRYADILLMNAEAHVELGSMNEAVWNKTVKAIRQRAGFTDSNALNYNGSADIKAIVRNERRTELAFEGHRLKDIIRWKTAETVLNGNVHGLYTGALVGTDNGYEILEKRSFDPEKHYLWPIPQKDKDINKNLSQNPNW